MPLYLIKVFLLLIFSLFIGYNYYFLSSGHITNFDGYFGYFTTIIIIYGIYKYIQSDSKGENFRISLKVIIGLFLTNLFVLCFYFFAITGDNAVPGFLLFFKILFYLIVPTSIFLVSTSFGKFLLNNIFKHLINSNRHLLNDSEHHNDEKNGTSWLLDLAVGFILFITLLIIFGIFGFYNIFAFLIILIAFGILSYKELLNILNSISNKKFVLDKKEGGQIKLVSLEFFWLIAFIVLGVGLISVVRPYPIGWDDLGAYMNMPHLMVEGGGLLRLGGMYAWQTFTGIGYMFNSPTQAFFLNLSSIFLSFIVLLVVLSDLLKVGNKERKSFLNLPIICSTLFIGLPMVGFHTKDMKLDEGLFFITIIGLFLLYKYYLALKEEKNVSIFYMFLIGIIIGFAFSIKFTALLLIIGMLGIISFARLGIFGFLGYLLVFLGVFTLGNFWQMMNIVVNPNNIVGFEKNFGIGAIVIGLGFLIFSAIKNLKENEKLVSYLKEVVIFLVGVILILLPWFGKNIYEINPNYSISGLLNGKTDAFIIDYTRIYPDSEVERITTEKAEERKKENLITTNEDMLRYFGYEKGILDYVNMFWNLTMQKNQAGEYTNIGWLFLALLPLIFIFLPLKKKYYFIFFVFLAFLQVIFYATPNSKFVNSKDLENFDKSVLSGVLVGNKKVFEHSKFSKNIYDVKIENYRLKFLENLEENPQIIEEAKQNNMNIPDYVDAIVESNREQIVLQFYTDLVEIVKNPNIGITINNFGDITQEDFEYLKHLNEVYVANNIFIPSNIVSFKELLNQKGLSQTDQENLTKLWKESRTFSGKITDFFANVNIPVGYIYLFLGFLIPTLFLIFTLKKAESNYLFKLNLVFAFLYVFLWLISSFGIVWYGITMYFSFFLMISLGAYYLSSYKDSDDEKKYLQKMIGSIVFLTIILIYTFFSLIPYIFSNLKTASYEDFKAGRITQSAAIFIHQPDYAKMIFTLNINEGKRLEFLKENIREDVLKMSIDIGNGQKSTIENIISALKDDINQVLALLSNLEQNGNVNAKISKENIYKGITNPKEEFKNKEIVYRIGTFLLYYISENNLRVFGDSLLFPFDDYIYSENISVTVDRLKDLGFKYLLVDLNSATIDSSVIHDLTKRYEHLLETFTSSKLELVSTDSICLEVALENYRNNGNLNQYMTLAGVNYESYDESGNQISRTTKKIECLNFISNLLENNLIDENNYSFLTGYKNYFENNELNINTLNSIVGSSYRALFEIR